MLDRYWRAYGPLIGTGVVLFFGWLALALTGNEERQARAYQSYGGATQYIERAVDPGPTVLPVEKAACAEAEAAGDADADQHDKRDLCAQFRAAMAAERNADLAFWQTIIGVFGLAAVLATLWANIGALKEAARSNDQARTFFAEERRPWIAVSGDEDVRESTKALLGDKAITFVIRAKNVGLSPALKVGALPHIVDVKFKREDIPGLLRKDISDLRAEKNLKGSALLPEQSATVYEHFMQLPAEERGKDILEHVMLVGVVYYLLPGSDEPHVTPFGWFLSWGYLSKNDRSERFFEANPMIDFASPD
ncbi:MAG: hypothetical protein IV086_08555 [Hyphomonadaceae bacterium]|nr:hypothetical protein [Hyphomonadaceae bacterium]